MLQNLDVWSPQTCSLFSLNAWEKPAQIMILENFFCPDRHPATSAGKRAVGERAAESSPHSPGWSFSGVAGRQGSALESWVLTLTLHWWPTRLWAGYFNPGLGFSLCQTKCLNQIASKVLTVSLVTVLISYGLSHEWIRHWCPLPHRCRCFQWC